MTTFTIDTDNNITAHGTLEEAAATTATPFDSFASQKELAELVAGWPAERLLAIWNGLPGVTPVKNFKDRTTAGSRIKQYQVFAVNGHFHRIANDQAVSGVAGVPSLPITSGAVNHAADFHGDNGVPIAGSLEELFFGIEVDELSRVAAAAIGASRRSARGLPPDRADASRGFDVTELLCQIRTGVIAEVSNGRDTPKRIGESVLIGSVNSKTTHYRLLDIGRQICPMRVALRTSKQRELARSPRDRDTAISTSCI